MPQNAYGKALLDAVINNQYEAAEALLKCHAPSDCVTETDHNSVLHHAILNDNLPMATLLLKHNCKIAFQNNRFLTPIAFAASLGKWNFVDLIADYCNASEDIDGFYKALCYAAKQDQGEIVAHLLHAKASPVSQTMQDNLPTPLESALANGNNDMVQRLVKHGANIASSVPKKVSPMMQAAKAGNWEALKLLANSRKKDYTEADLNEALCYAAECNQLDCVRALLKAGANPTVNYRILKKNEALHFAVINNNPEMIRLLISYRARILYDKNADGLTPLELATTTGKWNLLPVIVYAEKMLADLKLTEAHLRDCRGIYNRVEGLLTLDAKLKQRFKFDEFPGKLKYTLDLLAKALDTNKDEAGEAIEAHKELLEIIPVIHDHPAAQLSNEAKSTLKKLCDEGNHFAKILVELYTLIYWLYKNVENLRLVLTEMRTEIANTSWKYRGSFGVTKSGNPPHIEELNKLFSITDQTTCTIKQLFELYLDISKTLSTTKEKNRYRFDEVQDFYDKYRAALSAITFNENNIKASALEIIEEQQAKTESAVSEQDANSKIESVNEETLVASKTTSTQNLKADTNPSVTPPFTSTTARLYPTLDFKPSTSPTPAVKLNNATEPSPHPVDAARAYYDAAMQMQNTYVKPELPNENTVSYIPDFPPPSYNEHAQRTMQARATQLTPVVTQSPTSTFTLFPAPSAPSEEDLINQIKSMPTPPATRPVVASTPKSTGMKLAVAD